MPVQVLPSSPFWSVSFLYHQVHHNRISHKAVVTHGSRRPFFHQWRIKLRTAFIDLGLAYTRTGPPWSPIAGRPKFAAGAWWSTRYVGLPSSCLISHIQYERGYETYCSESPPTSHDRRPWQARGRTVRTVQHKWIIFHAEYKRSSSSTQLFGRAIQ